MKVSFHKNFELEFHNLPADIRQKTIELFTKDTTSPEFNDHALQALYKGYRSLNIDDEYRAFYRVIGVNEVVFTHVGKHSQLYSLEN